MFLYHVEECQGVVDVDVISVLLDKNHPLSPSAKNDDRTMAEVWCECHFCGNALAEIAEAIAGQSGVIFEEARVVFSKTKMV